MRRLRFHLGTLVILVLLLGIGFAALRESNEIWEQQASSASPSLCCRSRSSSPSIESRRDRLSGWGSLFWGRHTWRSLSRAIDRIQADYDEGAALISIIPN